MVDKGHQNLWRHVNLAVAEAAAGPAPASLPPASVPQVDVSCFVSPERATSAQRDAVVDQVLAASQTLGVMNIVGHGVPQPVVDDALGALEAFFRSPMEQKRRCIAQAGHATERGYVPYRSENVNVVLGRKGPADLREAYSFGPAAHAGGAEYGANTYPDFVDGFSRCVDGYYAEMERLERVLLEIFSLALSRATGRPLDPQHLLRQIEPNRGLMKAAWSPPCEASPDENRCSAHTDWGPLTILKTTSPGLEVCVRPQEGGGYRWQSVPVVPGAFTVNVADQLARWSNDTATVLQRHTPCQQKIVNALVCRPSEIAAIPEPFRVSCN